MTTKQVRETEAEAVAFVVCQSVGLQNGTASQDYVQLCFPSTHHGQCSYGRERYGMRFARVKCGLGG
jgi:hypothetical protein